MHSKKTMEGGSISDQKKKNNTFGFNIADEKLKLIDIQSENDDFLLANSHFSQHSFQEVGIIEQKEQNLPRKSLAWDSAFFNSAGVLDPDELSLLNRGFRKIESHLLNGTNEAESTSNAHDFSADCFEFEQSIYSFEFEQSIYNSMSCNALNVFDKNPEPGLSQKGMQDVQALKKADESSRSKMKSYQTSLGRSINVQSEGKTKMEPTSRRRNGTTPPPLPQKAIGSATNISTKSNNKENSSGKSYLKVDKRPATSCFISPKGSSVLPSINKPSPSSSVQASTFSKRETDSGKIRLSASIPTSSKIWRYAGRNNGMGDDINASTRSLSLSSSKRISVEPKDARRASALKGSLQSSLNSANSSRASLGTRLSTQTLRPSGIRPPLSHNRFSLENSAPIYHGETRTRKLPQKVISKGTTFGSDSKKSSKDYGSECKKLKTPCSDMPKNIKRPKIESSNKSQVMEEGRVVNQEIGMKKPSYSFDRLENLSRYFEAIDLNQEKRVNRPLKHSKIDVEKRGVPVFSVLKQENQLKNPLSVRGAASIPSMRTPLSDRTFSCNLSGTFNRDKLAKKASSVYATSKVLHKENS